MKAQVCLYNFSSSKRAMGMSYHIMNNVYAFETWNGYMLTHTWWISKLMLAHDFNWIAHWYSFSINIVILKFDSWYPYVWIWVLFIMKHDYSGVEYIVVN